MHRKRGRFDPNWKKYESEFHRRNELYGKEDTGVTSFRDFGSVGS